MHEKYKAYEGEDKVVTSHELYEELKRNRKDKPDILLRTGMPWLDYYLGGFELGEVTVISGVPGNGKTLLAKTFSHKFDTDKHMATWFSYEIQSWHFLDSFGHSLPLFAMPRKLRISSMQWLSERTKESIAKYGVKAIFIDHLHFIIDMANPKRAQAIDVTMRYLKRMAIELNICIFLIAHTVKTKIDPTEGLDMADLRDSGMIAAESDNVLFIWRTTKPDNGAILKIAKDRKNGNLGKMIRLVKTENGLLGEVISQGEQ